MKDKDFQNLLNKLFRANSKYKNLLREAEEEVNRRCGAHPSDVDNDTWIDTYHGDGDSKAMTVKQVADSMKECME